MYYQGVPPPQYYRGLPAMQPPPFHQPPPGQYQQFAPAPTGQPPPPAPQPTPSTEWADQLPPVPLDALKSAPPRLMDLESLPPGRDRPVVPAAAGTPLLPVPVAAPVLSRFPIPSAAAAAPVQMELAALNAVVQESLISGAVPPGVATALPLTFGSIAPVSAANQAGNQPLLPLPQAQLGQVTHRRDGSGFSTGHSPCWCRVGWFLTHT